MMTRVSVLNEVMNVMNQVMNVAEEGTLEQLEWTSDGQENQDTRPSPFITPKTQ